MSTVKNLIHEVHRRSLWQVLGIYLVAGWVVLQVVEVLTESAGLPDWTPGFAIALLLIGLPICLGTAFVQEGLPGGQSGRPVPHPEAEEGTGPAAPPTEGAHPTPETHRPSPSPTEVAPTVARGPRRFLTWRNAILGGVGAFALLGFTVFAYFVMWSSGVGPVGSLVAQGVIDEGDAIILAEFDNTSNDPTLGGMVTEALRVDLGGARTVTLLEPARVEDVLRRMGRDAAEPLRAEIAREVAVRDGIKAVVDGEVGSAGSGYILVATIRAADTGAPLATFRRTADGPDDVISAIDGLSQDIRERAGESLRSIRSDEPLEQVTTSSLEALRKYTEALRLEEAGDHVRVKAFLEEAIALDPEFAMAYRMLAVSMQDAGGTREEEMAAATRAYELRHRLSERERYIASAYYHRVVTGDLEEQARAYQTVLDRHPDDRSALNNLAIVHADRTRWEEAVALLERAISGPGSSGSAYTNIVTYKTSLGDWEGAREILDQIETKDVWYYFIAVNLAAARGDAASSHAHAEALSTLPEAPPAWRYFGLRQAALVDAMEGRMAEARDHMREAISRARTDRRFTDAVLAHLDLVQLERLIDPASGAAKETLQDLFSGQDLSSIPGPARPYDEIAGELARAGLVAEAATLLDEWQAEGGPTAAEVPLAEANRALGAYRLADDDPGAAADALLSLRAQLDCPRCEAWEIGDLMTRAGRIEEAVVERERSRSVAQATRWFGVHRVLSLERLGALYEELGDSTRAAESYRAFAEAWSEAGPALQPRVDHARARARALTGGTP